VLCGSFKEIFLLEELLSGGSPLSFANSIAATKINHIPVSKDVK